MPDEWIRLGWTLGYKASAAGLGGVMDVFKCPYCGARRYLPEGHVPVLPFCADCKRPLQPPDDVFDMYTARRRVD